MIRNIYLRGLLRGLLGLLVVLLLAMAGGYGWLRGSLAQREGTQSIVGLGAPVEVLRDAQGIVRIEAGNRADIALALGYVHAQERFFQMDLQRRRAAGELSALFGAVALPADEPVRIHRFRARAQRNLALLAASERELLGAYAQGVNAGLGALRSQPWEYAVLRATPEPWLPEDSVLVVFSMYLELQDEHARFERGLGLMADTLPADLYRFFSQQGGEWDAPLEGEPWPAEPIPTHGFEDLTIADLDQPLTPPFAVQEFTTDDAIAGSNNWAVSGRLTQHGGALLANDMHLSLSVPNIWFRAGWTHPESGRLVSGATLPGTPLVVAGSNGKVAWGYTNTQGDWSDVVLLETSADGNSYRTPEGFEAFTKFTEQIEVKGGEARTLKVRETRWGPVIGRNHAGVELALRWTAHDPEGVNFGNLRLETVDSVEAAAEWGPAYGIPHQNLVLADAEGSIGWTLAGPVPRRTGHDGVLPVRWDQGNAGWDGYLDSTEQPRILNPESGRLWTANSRILSGADFQLMGSQGAALGARQQQIRDRLLAREHFDEAAMLEIQLDDEALFLARWQQRLLAVLERTAGDPELAAALPWVRDWSGHAAADDVGYLLVEKFREQALRLVAAPLAAWLEKRDPEFRIQHVARQLEYPVWALLQARPQHLLNPEFADWQALELEAFRLALAPLVEDGTLANDSWGEHNRLAISHPLVRALAFLEPWLSMPAEPMPGGTHVPRVQSRNFGASERFGISPGREDQAYFHMATGQSAHPLSPWFDAGHRDWVEGRASPWLGGEMLYRLRLEPR